MLGVESASSGCYAPCAPSTTYVGGVRPPSDTWFARAAKAPTILATSVCVRGSRANSSAKPLIRSSVIRNRLTLLIHFIHNCDLCGPGCATGLLASVRPGRAETRYSFRPVGRPRSSDLTCHCDLRRVVIFPLQELVA